MSHSTTLHNPQSLPVRAIFPTKGKSALGDYNPLLSGRKCGSCGQRDGWRRMLRSTNPGGWVCCGWVEEPVACHSDLAHVCTAMCLGGVA